MRGYYPTIGVVDRSHLGSKGSLLLKEGWHPLSESEADDGVVNQPRG